MKKIYTVLLVGLLMLTTAGCSNNTTATTDGTFTSTQQGNNGELTVEVVMDGETISSVTVTEHEETAGISDPAINELPKIIVDNQTVNVETIAGCTVTSNAIISAVKDALSSNGYDLENYSNEVEDAEKGETVSLEADVVIIGGGGAGLAAANSAIEEGASVIIIDKMSGLGGNTAAADGLYNAVDPERQAAMDIDDSIEQFYEDTFVGGGELAKPELVKILTENAMESINWLETKGYEIDEKIYLGTGALWPRGHYGANHTGADYTSILEKFAVDNGAVVLTNTKGVELVQDDTGRVTGVLAENDENDYVLSANKGVIIATGGFGHNVEMREEYNTLWENVGEDVLCSNVPSATGDGIILATDIGANVVGMEYIQFYPVGDVNTGALGSTLPGGTTSRIAINKEGKRFMAEDAGRDYQSSSIFAQTDGQCYIVVDADTINTDEKIANVQKYIDNGEVLMGNTVEELAEQLGVESSVLQDTFDTYNAAVDAGVDEEFGRVLLDEKMENGPFYVGLRAPTLHHTMGGIEINENTEVLDVDGNIIDGLFAAGEVTGGIHGNNRLGGNALADVMVFGRIAGTTAASKN